MITENTQYRYCNLHNLEYGQFESNSKYDIPDMLPVNIDTDTLRYTPLQGFSFAIADKNRKNKSCHFFQHDFQFERVWTHPQRYMKVLQDFKFVLSPDFSPYEDMPKATKIYNVYRNRWCGRYWQENGIKVIPTVTWSDTDSLDFVFDGIPQNSIIAISTMGEGRWQNYKLLYNTWDIMMNKLKPKIILLYGKDISKNLTGNIIYKPLSSKKII